MTKKKSHFNVSSFTILILLLVWGDFLKAQTSAAALDSLSYQQYLQQDWKALVKTGKLMKRSGLDFYYMHMRLGLARQALKQYNLAGRHFQKALKHVPYDETAQGFLFQSLLDAQQGVEAGALYQKMLKSAAADPAKFTIQPLSFHADLAYTYRNQINGLDKMRLTGNLEKYGQERTYENNFFYDAGIHLLLRPNLIFYAGVQWIDMNVKDHFSFQQYGLMLERIDEDDYFKQYYYRLDSVVEEQYAAQQLQQRAGYFQAQIGASPNWKLTAAVQLYTVQSNFSFADSSSITVSDTMLFDKQTQEVSYITATFPALTFKEIGWKTTDFSVSLNSMVHKGNFSWLAGFAHAGINDTSIWQLNTGLQHRPMGNQDVYHQLEANAVFSNGALYPSWKYRLGLKLHRQTWLEAEWLQGRLNNLSDQFGYIIFNHPDILKRHLELSISQGITKNFYLQLRYRNLSAERLYYWTEPGTNNWNADTYPIHAQTIIGGIKWIF